MIAGAKIVPTKAKESRWLGSPRILLIQIVVTRICLCLDCIQTLRHSVSATIRFVNVHAFAEFIERVVIVAQLLIDITHQHKRVRWNCRHNFLISQIEPSVSDK